MEQLNFKQTKKPLIIAHRGASKVAFENTMEAFLKAVEFGADMVEMDVRKTADNILVTFHDSRIFSKKINKISYSQLNQLAGKKGFAAPRLEQVLNALKDKIKLDVEIKEGGFEQQTLDLVLKYFHLKDFIVTSFKKSVLIKIKKFQPQVKVGLLLGSKSRLVKRY